MRKVLLFIYLLLFSIPIEAQVTPPSSTYKVVATCGGQALSPGSNSGPFMDTTGAACSSATLSGTISGNAAAGLTGSNPPGSAGYTGVKDTSSGFLAGVTGTVVGGSEAMNVNILGGAATGVAQGSTTSGQTGGLIQGATTTSAPTYTTATTNPLSLDTSGNLRVTVAGGGGTTNITQQTSTNLGTPTAYGTAPTGNALSTNSFVTNLVVDAANQATATSAPLPAGVVYFSGGNVLTNGQVGYMAADSLSRPLVDVAVSVLPTGAATGVAQASTTSGQSGTLVQGAVTTSGPSYSTGQTSPLSLDTSGNLRVNVVAGGASGGTSSTFGAAFPGTGTAIGVKNGSNMVNLIADASNNLDVDIAAGIAVDAPVGSSPTSNPPPMGCINGASTVTSGQMNIVTCDTTGHLQVGVTAASGAFASGSIASGAFATGSLTNAIPDPCTTTAKATFPVNISTATTTVIHAAVASNNFYICELDLVAGAAQTIALIDGTGGTCSGGTPTGLSGGATAATGYSFAANGGISKGNGLGTVAKTSAVNRDVCLITGQAAQISGTVVYATAP